jgi:hypothetical protein
METEIIKNSQTITEAIKKIYGYDNGKSRKKFFELIDTKNLDIKHLRKRELKYPIISKTCPVCEKTFETKNGSKDEKTTCSYSCSNTYFRSGENNPNWGIGGDSEERNGYRRIGFNHHKKECVVCGENKIVAIHHFDENHFNNSPENLIPLCPTHHQYIHSQYKNEIIDIVVKYRDNFVSLAQR